MMSQMMMRGTRVRTRDRGYMTKLRAHHAGDRPAGSDRRQRRRRIDGNLSQRRPDAAEEIEDDESAVAEAVLDVIAEDPQSTHMFPRT